MEIIIAVFIFITVGFIWVLADKNIEKYNNKKN